MNAWIAAEIRGESFSTVTFPNVVKFSAQCLGEFFD
jgi:hypothetical protein